MQTCLCHPSEDVQIYALRAPTRMKAEASLPFLVRYARSKAVWVSGSENATIHGIICDECKVAMSAITEGASSGAPGNPGQDPEGLTASADLADAWLADRLRNK